MSFQWTYQCAIAILTIGCMVYSTVTLNDHVKCHIQRNSSMSGLHRKISTSIEIEAHEKDRIDHCSFALMETLPEDIYIDLYQLAMEEPFGGPRVYCEDDINLEAPAYQSQAHKVYVYGTRRSKANNISSVTVTLPVHLRYQRPQNDSSISVILLQTPLLLHRCSDLPSAGAVQAPCPDTANVSCVWQTLKCDPKPGEGLTVLELIVPVGRTRHQTVVVWGTLTASTVAVLVLIYVMLSTPLKPNNFTVIKKKL